MPSKDASPIVQLRIPPAVLAEIDASCLRQPARFVKPDGKPNRSAWLVAAALDKLRHAERSKRVGADSSPVKRIQIAEQHRRDAFAAGLPWSCKCPACLVVGGKADAAMLDELHDDE